MSNTATTSPFGTLTVLEDQCAFSSDRRKAKILIASALGTATNYAPAIEELSGKAAKDLAVAYAAQHGISDPRIDGLAGAPFGVNAEGESLDQVPTNLPPTHVRRRIVGYRVAVPVTGRLF